MVSVEKKTLCEQTMRISRGHMNKCLQSGGIVMIVLVNSISWEYIYIALMSK